MIICLPIHECGCGLMFGTLSSFNSIILIFICKQCQGRLIICHRSLEISKSENILCEQIRECYECLDMTGMDSPVAKRVLHSIGKNGARISMLTLSSNNKS